MLIYFKFKSNTLVLKGEQQSYLLASSTANCQAYKLLNGAQSSSFLLPSWGDNTEQTLIWGLMEKLVSTQQHV